MVASWQESRVQKVIGTRGRRRHGVLGRCDLRQRCGLWIQYQHARPSECTDSVEPERWTNARCVRSHNGGERRVAMECEAWPQAKKVGRELTPQRMAESVLLIVDNCPTRNISLPPRSSTLRRTPSSVTSAPNRLCVPASPTGRPSPTELAGHCRDSNLSQTHRSQRGLRRRRPPSCSGIRGDGVVRRLPGQVGHEWRVCDVRCLSCVRREK